MSSVFCRGALVLALISGSLSGGGARASPGELPARSAKVSTSSQAVDLNRASEEDLMRLPGIGRRRAQLIVERRSKRPFKSAQELAGIKGIGPKLFKKLRAMVRVDAPPHETRR
jgi:competence protein ComEA